MGRIDIISELIMGASFVRPRNAQLNWAGIYHSFMLNRTLLFDFYAMTPEEKYSM